jgi:hypothetical protein
MAGDVIAVLVPLLVLALWLILRLQRRLAACRRERDGGRAGTPSPRFDLVWRRLQT